MKKILYLFLLFLLPVAAEAQDARQRSLETIVADGLAQLPVQDTPSLDAAMQELAATGARGVKMMADMLVPASEGKNATVEYALSGVVNYVTAEGCEALAEGVREGLCEALKSCSDKPNQAFLISLLQLCSTEEQIPLLVESTRDADLADYAVRALISTPGSDKALLDLIAGSAEPNALLAYAAAERQLTEAEGTLLQWAAAAGDDATKEAVCNALGRCGTEASLKTLAAAAKAADYAFTPGDATSAYLQLVGRLAREGSGKALSAARTLLRSERQHIRTAALDIVLSVEPAKRTSYILAAVKDPSREYRCAALHLADDFADEALCAAICEKMKSYDDVTRTDVVNWLGSRHAAAQSATIVAAIASENEELALAAIRAAGRIGGEEALEALVAQLDGPYGAQAEAAIAAFNGDTHEALVDALDGSPATQARALKLAAAPRRAIPSGGQPHRLGPGCPAVLSVAGAGRHPRGDRRADRGQRPRGRLRSAADARQSRDDRRAV